MAAFAPNVPALYELHFAVPMAGAVLSALNFLLDDTMLAVVLRQLEPTFIFVDYQFVHVVLKALHSLTQTPNDQRRTSFKTPILVLIPECHDQKLNHDNDHEYFKHYNLPEGALKYNDLVEDHDHEDYFKIIWPSDERDPISVNYTSGSTGNPKGVVYSHRAVYLNSLAIALNTRRSATSAVFLWTVDMFRCNGWCYTWAMAALGGTNVCLRNVTLSATTILDAILLHNVTHMCGKPAILNTLASHNGDQTPTPLPSRVDIIVAGALPSHEILAKVTEMGFDVSHGYGMTEALGPAIIEPWRPDQANVWYRHGLITIDGFDVKDPNTMESVPDDGKTIGEIMFRGQTLMSGYLGNPEATEKAYKDGWYRTGDVGIRHRDGWIQMKDRAEDIVVCGGKAISTLEIEAVLLRHPCVSAAAVVGRIKQYHDHHGDGLMLGNHETLCAFVKLKEGRENGTNVTSAKQIMDFCADNLSAYMVPHAVIFGDLPVNSTGKVQKFVLRYKANATTNGS